jgi:hypothetical protein
MRDLADSVTEQFSSVRDQALDVMEALSSQAPSKAIDRYTKAIEGDIKPYQIADYVNDCAKSTPNMTRDSEEIAKGKIVPAHIQYRAPFHSLAANRRRLSELASTLRKTIEALSLANEIVAAKPSSKVIFIGHGRSEQWRVLKDFLGERLGLSFDEFNRISPAGISTQERLSEMIDKCGFAFLVLPPKTFTKTTRCMLVKMLFTKPVYFRDDWAGVEQSCFWKMAATNSVTLLDLGKFAFLRQILRLASKRSGAS